MDRVYVIRVEDVSLEKEHFALPTEPVSSIELGTYASLDAAIKAVRHPKGVIVSGLLGGEGWMIGRAQLEWEEVPPRSELYNVREKVLQPRSAQFLVKDPRWPTEDRLLYVIDVKPTDVLSEPLTGIQHE